MIFAGSATTLYLLAAQQSAELTAIVEGYTPDLFKISPRSASSARRAVPTLTDPWKRQSGGA